MRLPANLKFGRFLRHLSVLFTGTLIASVFSFATQLALTRSLTVAEFGRIAALLAVVNIVTPIASAGINWFLLQAFGREGWAAVRWLRPSALLAAMATALGCLVVGGYALHGGDTTATERALVLVTAIPILLGQVAIELASTRFQLEGRYEGLAIWQTAMQTGRLVAALGVVVVVPFAAFSGTLIGYAIIGAVTAAVGLHLMRGFWTGRFHLAGHAAPAATESPSKTPSLAHTATATAPFALMTIFYLVYFQGGVIILEWLRGGSAAAIYNAAFLVISAIFLVPNVIYMRLLIAPLCRWAEHDRGRFEAALHIGVPAMAMLGTILAIMTAVSAAWIIPLLFGTKYAASVLILQILSVSIPVRFVQSAYSSMFVSKDNMVRKVKYLSASAAAGVALSLCLVPPLGVEGAAIATVLAETTLLVLHICGTRAVITGFSLLETLRVATIRSALRHFGQESRLGA
jgi:O-antigen/teichoic acid export membrane protein